jgi:Fe(3+) dicitrate transport protein
MTAESGGAAPRVPSCSARSRLLASLFLTLPLLALPAGLNAAYPADGASEARILGTVVAADTRVPLSGVQVRLEGRSTTTTTSPRGTFTVARVPAEAGASVTLHFSRIGYRPLARQVELHGPDEVVRLEVELEPAALALDPVAILLERTRMVGDPDRLGSIPGSAFYLGWRDLETQKLAHDNVHDVLRQLPGVNVQDEEGYGLRPHIGLRGVGAERSSNVTVMEDGVLIAPAPYSAPAAYYFPVMGRMEGIEVRKGASQIRYGPRTMGGAVNLLTSSIPSRMSWYADVSGGQDATLRARLRAGDSRDHLGWLVEGYQIRTDGFKEIQGGGDTGFTTRDLMAKLRFNTDREAPRYQELELKVGVQDHRSDETYLGLTEADFRVHSNLRYAASRNDVMDTDHQQVQARYFSTLTPSTDVVVTAYRNEFARNWYKLQSVQGASIAQVLADPEAHSDRMGILQGTDSGDDALWLRANNRSYLSQGIQSTLGWQLGSDRFRHDLEFGVRYHQDYEDRLQWEDGYRMSSGQLIQTLEGTPGSQANRKSEASAWAFHLQDEIRAGRLSVVPGVRYESVRFTRSDWAGGDGARQADPQVRESTVSALIPGVGATWEWSPRVHLFAGVHRGFGPPGPGADNDTKVEESLNWESGVRVRRAGFGLNLTGFFSDYSNILGRATLAGGETGTGELFNGGSVEVWGVEAAADTDLARYLDLPLELPVRATYTFNRGTFLTSFESEHGPWGTVAAGDRVPYLPEHLFSGSVGVNRGGWGTTLAWNGSSAMRTVAGRGAIAENEGTDRFVVFNLSGEYELPGGGTLYGGVQNLIDERYVVSRRPAGARPGLPRTLFVGVRIVR